MAAARGTQTLAEIANETGVHPTQISQWRSQLLEDVAHVFSSYRVREFVWYEGHRAGHFPLDFVVTKRHNEAIKGREQLFKEAQWRWSK